jgi:hypothetical protein
MDPSNPGKMLAQEVLATVKAVMPWMPRNRFGRRGLSRKTRSHVDPPDVENEEGK